MLPAAGMTLSVRMRRDVVIVDPDRFLAAARAAFRELHPDASEAAATEAVGDVHDAMFALLERAGPAETTGPRIWPSPGDPPEFGRGAEPPGHRVTDRSDGLSPAGWLQQVVLEPQPLQDVGCFFPADPFALPQDRDSPR